MCNIFVPHNLKYKSIKSKVLTIRNKVSAKTSLKFYIPVHFFMFEQGLLPIWWKREGWQTAPESASQLLHDQRFKKQWLKKERIHRTSMTLLSFPHGLLQRSGSTGTHLPYLTRSGEIFIQSRILSFLGV